MSIIEKYNKRRFTIDTTGFEYVKLEDLYNEEGPDHVWPLRGLYINTKSQYDPETPVAAIDDRYVNLPPNQLDSVKGILADKDAIAEINNGEAGFIINTYVHKTFKNICYSVKFVARESD